MGLDMYLNKQIYIGAQYDFRSVEGEINLSYTTGDGERKPIKINVNRVDEIIERVAYWRKSNAIHQWFINNCADGVDECQEIYVSEENLKQLSKIVEEVLSTPEKAEKLLPTQSGFFFGSTDYGEWYIRDLEYTKGILDEILKEERKPWTYYFYRASW